MSPEAGNVELFGTKVSNIQSRVKVQGDTITGTLKYLDTGAIPDVWGAGNFLALKFTDIPETATSCKVGLDPSEGSGLVEIINDPDRNGVFKVTNKNTQNFKIVTTDGEKTTTQIFDLQQLNCQTE